MFAEDLRHSLIRGVVCVFSQSFEHLAFGREDLVRVAAHQDDAVPFVLRQVVEQQRHHLEHLAADTFTNGSRTGSGIKNPDSSSGEDRGQIKFTGTINNVFTKAEK